MLDNQNIRPLCLAYTSLNEADIGELEVLAEKLELMARLNQTDMFIDAPIKDSTDSIVLAWAHDNKSLYRKSVVGEIAYAGCEPAVSMAVSSQKRVEWVSGVSQEMLPIEQTVVPLVSCQQRVIGVLIMERQIDMQGIVIDEINHRVKNTLQNVISLLRMQMRRSSEKQIHEEFQAGINRILSIAKVYEVFTYQSKELVNLRELTVYIMEKIIESCSNGEDNIRTQISGSEVMLNATKAVPVALVLNELVSNAVKHGMKNNGQGRIQADITECHETVKISIWNNGCPVAEDVLEKLDKRKNLGMYLVKLFICEQLKGTVKLFNQNNGVCARIEFPVQSIRIKGGRQNEAFNDIIGRG